MGGRDMSADAALHAARVAGVSVSISGENLTLRAGEEPPAHVVRELRQHKHDILVLLRQERTMPASPACPADVAERASIIAEGDRVGHEIAVERALAEAGHQSWQDLSQAHRRKIETALDRLPAPNTPLGARLIERTQAVIGSELFHTAVLQGWDMTAMFGVAPVAPDLRVGEQGLVPQLVFSRLPVKQIELLTSDHAIIEYRTGSKLRFDRFRPALEHAVLWWECDALINGAVWGALN